MSDNNEDYDEYGNPIDTSGQGLRTQLKKALADKKAAESERDQLRSQVAETSSVAIFKDKGYAPAVARLAVKDGLDLSDEKAIDKWLTDNGELFVKAASEQSPSGEAGDKPEPPPAQTSAIPSGSEDAFGAISRIHAAASPAQVNAYERALASLPDNATTEQVKAALKGL